MKDIKQELRLHLKDTIYQYDIERVVGIFLQGSQNYGLEYEGSDVDTKCILMPTFDDLAFNRNPVSTTFVRENDEHIDMKDLRLYLQTFRKANPNFVEILFTDYKIVLDPMWNELVSKREEIARIDPDRAIKAMLGMVMEKQHALQHPYPSKLAILDRFGYDPKQLSHLLRVREMMERYMNNEEYAAILKPKNPQYLLDVKKGLFSVEDAVKLAEETVREAKNLKESYELVVDSKKCACSNVEADLDKFQYEMMRKYIKTELEEV